MANGSPPLVAPKSGGAATSPWFALRYVENQLPYLSPNQLVHLVASIGAETKGRYTFSSVVHATNDYANTKQYPSVGFKWRSYVGQVVAAAGKHHHKDWVTGFSYSSGDIPGTGGPSTIQKAADSGAANTVVGIGHSLGSLFSGSNLVGIIILVVLLVVVLGRK